MSNKNKSDQSGPSAKRLPGDEALVRGELEQLFEAAGRKGLARAELDAWAAERGVGARLDAALDELEAAATVVLWNRRWIGVRHTDWTAGKVRTQGRGGALLLSGARGEAGFFIPARELKEARDGDLVLVRPVRSRRAGKGGGRRARSGVAGSGGSGGRLPEASVVKILARGAREVVGFIDPAQPRELAPFDSRSRLQVTLAERRPDLDGHFVVASLQAGARGAAGGGSGSRAGGRSRGQGAGVPAAHLEDLGPIDEPGTDVLVVLRHFEIPESHSAASLEDAGGRPSEPRPEDIRGRRDLREIPTITIDGESARDFDDAISIRRRPGRKGEPQGYELAVHIADVAHYVTEGGVLDLEAYDRGTSVYFPDRAIPMLPEALSNGLCSLRPEVERLAMTAFLEFSATGEPLGRRFAESVIRSDRRFTYTEVRDILGEPGKSQGRGFDGDPQIHDLLLVARDLMRQLFRRRTERGSIDFDLPEGDVILDTEGVTIGIKPGERNVAHRMIEEFMIAANEAVAAELVGAEEPALYRVHTEPDRERFEELRSFLEPLGIPLDLGPEALHPSHLQEVLRRVEGHAEETFVATLILRSMKRAEYHPECKGHYALASRTYTHFTSPIRRYPDLVVHRALKRLLRGERLAPHVDAAYRARLVGIAEHTSLTERRAERAERALLQWKVIRLLAPREGEVFSGRVTGVQPFGVFVQLDGYYADGLLPIADLTDDYYTFEAEKHRLVGRRGRVIRLADQLDVKLATVDPMRRLLTLGLPG